MYRARLKYHSQVSRIFQANTGIVVSNSMNKIHQTWEWKFSPPLYIFIFQVYFCYTLINFQVALVENDALVLKGHFKDGIPVSGEVSSSSKIVNVNTAVFPLQLDFGISSIDCDEELSSDSCPAHGQSEDPLSAIRALQGGNSAQIMGLL